MNDNYEGYIIPTIYNETMLNKIATSERECENYVGGGEGYDCDSIGDCDTCLLNNCNRELLGEYISSGKVSISTKTQTTKENNMNKNISEVFDKTKDALLVEKHLGSQIGTYFIDGLILADKKTEVLAEAKRLEKEEKDK